MTTEGMNRFEPFGPPGSRGGLKTVLDAADKIAANSHAITEIKQLLAGMNAGAVIPSRRIRAILKQHGL